MKIRFVILFTISLLLVSGCESNSISRNTKELTKKIEVKEASNNYKIDESKNLNKEISKLGFEILNQNFKDENIIISPLSIVSALGMTANGAEKDTLDEFEEIFSSDLDLLNNYIGSYVKSLPSDENKISIANSIWIKDKDNIKIEDEFLLDNKKYYNSKIFLAPFDESTKNDINEWVNNETNGIIEKLIDKLPNEDVVMYLINALSFDAEWRKIYENTDVRENIFVTNKGKEQIVEFMSSEESKYIENENIKGFIKPYKNNDYAFVALLPNEEIEFNQFLKTIKGNEIIELIEQAEKKDVFAKIPKFSVEYSKNLNESLKNIGLTKAFSEFEANFKRINNEGGEQFYISKVIHKAKIDVNEKGTKAGAATSVEMKNESAMVEEEIKEVILDRPFVYLIIDTKYNLPLFIGNLVSVK